MKENRLVCEKEKSFQYFKKIVFLSQMSQCQITDCMTRSAGGHGTFKEDVSCLIIELESKVREDITITEKAGEGPNLVESMVNGSRCEN